MPLVMRLLNGLPGALGFVLRQKVYPKFFASCGRGVVFGRHLTLKDPSRIWLGQNVVLSDYATLAVDEPAGSVVIGDGAFIGIATTIRARAAEVLVDEGANLGSECHVTPCSAARIGRHVLFAAFCKVGLNEDDAAPMTEVGDGCWLGVRVRVRSGAKIGPDSIVGAHAEVSEDLPGKVIAIGVPARVLRNRS